MTKVVTVNDLLRMCYELSVLGKGRKKILLATDDEGNEYRELSCFFTDKVEEFYKICTMPKSVTLQNAKEYIILG